MIRKHRLLCALKSLDPVKYAGMNVSNMSDRSEKSVRMLEERVRKLKAPIQPYASTLMDSRTANSSGSAGYGTPDEGESSEEEIPDEMPLLERPESDEEDTTIRTPTGSAGMLKEGVRKFLACRKFFLRRTILEGFDEPNRTIYRVKENQDVESQEFSIAVDAVNPTKPGWLVHKRVFKNRLDL